MSSRKRRERANGLLTYDRAVIRVDVSKRESTFRVVQGDPVAVLIYGQEHYLDGRELAVSMD